jgi:hypothetical protein
MFDVPPEPDAGGHSGAIRTSRETDKVFAALAKAQGDIPTPKRDRVVDTGKYSYSYADLASIRDVCRKPLKDNGIAVIQSAVTRNYSVEITTLLAHASGQWVECGPLVVDAAGGQNVAQATGSVITYLKRYALSAALCIATDDDDDAQSAAAEKKPAKGKAKTKTETETRGINKKSEVSEKQKKMLFALSMDKANELGIKQKKIVDDLLLILGYESTSEITKADVDKCKSFFENYGKNGATKSEGPVAAAHEDAAEKADGLAAEEPPF